MKYLLDEDINASLVPGSAPSEGDPLNVLLEELMETDILPDLLPQPKPETEPMQVFQSDSWGITADDFQWSVVSNAAHSTLELSIDDFEVPANSLTLIQIPFLIIAQSVTLAQSL